MKIEDLAVKLALKELGKPYESGGQGPDKWDCSGLIVEILKYCMVFPPELKDAWAQKLYEIYRDMAVLRPQRGCVAFFGKNLTSISHCVLLVSSDVCIGANGKPQDGFVALEPLDYRIRKYKIDDLIAICNPFKEVF